LACVFTKALSKFIFEVFADLPIARSTASNVSVIVSPSGDFQETFRLPSSVASTAKGIHYLINLTPCLVI